MAGLKSSQAPKQLSPNASKSAEAIDLQTTAHSRRLTDEPASPIALSTDAWHGLPPVVIRRSLQCANGFGSVLE
eukprot:CAMPEP_0169245694 /NCGR_PEP_ID=MMETSP1016-20121227/34332_1 /TAXON_ID=342587 /ORGANISM="Karlodinium micrum, Strain CCMP2283" /LENGTH=73 /DNA_ID=CAMNT_0009326213 /DNA_START=157 /DNA_END=378 /DNA_ORIENTATION=+